MSQPTRPQPPNPLLPGIDQLRAVIAALRGPGGCPWDHEQSHRTLRGGLLEEAYEVVAAIDAGDDENLREELGDLLLQVVFHSRIAEEEGRWDFDAVARENAAKLVRRHPHVFAEEHAEDSAAVLRQWDEIKRVEKGSKPDSALDGITPGLPALIHADKVQKKAAKVGFDWPDAEPVFAKVSEELNEIREALAAADHAAIEDEIGDLLFAAVNLARKTGCDPEVALQAATAKFTDRFKAVETLAAIRGIELANAGLATLDTLWDEVKAEGVSLTKKKP